MRSNTIRTLAAGVYALPGAQAVVSFTKSTGADVSFGSTSVLKQGDLKIAPWGADNLQPQRMLALVYGNHLKPQLIYTARDFLLGSELGLYRKVIEGRKKIYEPVIDPKIEDWLEMIDVKNLMRASAFNMEFSDNYFSAFELDKRKEVVGIQNFDCTMTRAGVTTAMRPERYHLHPDWRNVKAAEIQTLPAYDRKNPLRFGDFIYHGRDWTVGQKYYSAPPFWGTEKWTKLSNKIPDFHLSGLDNGYNVKYHIEIPADYFDQYGDTDKEREEAEKLLLEQMNEMMSGVDNVDKVFVSKFAVDSSGKQLPGWKITPLANTMSDKAYEAVNQQANIAHTAGHGIDPSLAGIDTGSKLGGSGSEKRISYQLHIALRTPNKRDILLEQLNVAKKINGWNPEYVFRFDDIEITTLAEEKTGKKELETKGPQPQE